MRLLFVLILNAVFLFSCNNKKEENKEKPPVIPDSTETVISNRVTNSYAPVDISPMDMSYFPVDYPKLKTKSTSIPPFARIIYSRPHLQGRKLFHDILKYGEPWRLGANEATELQLYKAATIQGKTINEGRYVLYCIPDSSKWTIVLNTNIDSWGLHPDPSKDIARFSIPVKSTPDLLEYFTIIFRASPTGADLVMAWENVEAVLPISF